MDEVCNVCRSVGFDFGDDGFYYCGICYTRAEDLIDTCTDDADLFNKVGMYSQRHCRRTPSKPEDDVKFCDGIGPSGPTDFGSSQTNGTGDDYYRAIRWKYVLGFQVMLQLQSKGLIQHFNVNPNIIDLHNPIWLRLLAHTRLMTDQWDEWAKNVLDESGVNNPGEVTKSQRSARLREKQHVWYRSLRKCLPISYTLALSFLFCHVAEEPILPTDVLKGVLEGKIPYFTAFVDIEEQVGHPTILCPISCSVMFRPTQVISLQKLEAAAASIAKKIGLELRPLNFKTLATRYMEELSLPVPKILPLASRIHESSVPQGIYLSGNELKLPSRILLMSILVVATRVYYNINGFGKWESTMSNSSSSLPRGKLNGKNNTSAFDIGSDGQEEDFVPDIGLKDYEVHEFDVVELLHTLDEKFIKLCELHDNFAHYKDLPSYLQFCKDGVFAGLEPLCENQEEGGIMEDLWKFYQDQKDYEPSKDGILRPIEDEVCTPTGHRSPQGDGIPCDTLQADMSEFAEETSNCLGREDIVREASPEVSSDKDRAIRSMKRDMDDNKFVYIPPRSRVKRDDHIFYCRKQSNGALCLLYMVITTFCLDLVPRLVRLMLEQCTMRCWFWREDCKRGKKNKLLLRYESRKSGELRLTNLSFECS